MTVDDVYDKLLSIGISKTDIYQILSSCCGKEDCNIDCVIKEVARILEIDIDLCRDEYFIEPSYEFGR